MMPGVMGSGDGTDPKGAKTSLKGTEERGSGWRERGGKSFYNCAL